MADKNWSTARQRFKAAQPPPTQSSTPQQNKAPLPKQPFHIEPIIAFYIFFASHVIAAIWSPIQDCDEVFNYWEPTHYLNHGYGFQTWEYSPEYAIRSWLYAGLHSVVILLSKLLPVVGYFAKGKLAEFYALRVVLGLCCAVCESRLFGKISQTLNPRIAILFMIIMVSSPGMYHASVAYLPSSFAMYSTMLGMAAFMDWRGGLRTAQGIFWFGFGAFLGWPFAAAMSIPFIAEEFLFAGISDQDAQVAMLRRFIDGTVRSLLVLAAEMAVDTFFYKKLVCVPFNIVRYNVLSAGKRKGPNIYGTEPWHFYLRNLALNFNFWLILALASMPLLLMQHFLRGKSATKQSYLRGLVFLSPFYLWLTIFTIQPHKEERFMYPAYPALALNAAVGLHIILNYMGSPEAPVVGKIPAQLKFLAVSGFMLLVFDISVFRTLGTFTGYAAPLSVYKPLHDTARAGDTVCLGKEWYRYPSSFHLPEGVKAKFVKSEFSGLLPGEFSEAKQGFGFFAGTWLVPPGMNDENKEDVGKYTDIRHCTFLIDSSSPSMEPTSLEPDYVHSEEWEKVQCNSFLDAASTHIIGRLGWIPDMAFIPNTYRRVFGEYCLLKRKSARR